MSFVKLSTFFDRYFPVTPHFTYLERLHQMLSKRLFSELYTCKYYTTYWFRARWEKSLFFSIANHNLITSSIQKYVDFLTDRSCHTTNLRVPQGRETPCCISLLQQGGFHTTGILQTNRNTWIQGTRKTFKSSESYTISQKSLLIT